MRLAVAMQLVQARLLDLLTQGLRRSPLTDHFRICSRLTPRRAQESAAKSRPSQPHGYGFAKVAAICAAALLATGCAGYRLGPVNDQTAGDKSVEIQPFNNQTLQPRLGDAVTQALREGIQTDGTFHLANGEADIVVSGIITSYTRTGLSYLSSDVLTANNYQVGMVGHVVIRERVTGKVLLDKDVKGYTLVHVGSDLQSSERQAMPLLAEDFARKVTQMLAEGTW